MKNLLPKILKKNYPAKSIVGSGPYGQKSVGTLVLFAQGKTNFHFEQAVTEKILSIKFV